jgi:hypothetical protein
MQFPIGLFGVAVGTAAIPVLSRLASEKKIPEFRETISSSLNLVFLMTLPVRVRIDRAWRADNPPYLRTRENSTRLLRA